MSVSVVSRPMHNDGLRVMDPGRDLHMVADLVEEVFAPEMDERGHRAMQEIRALAKAASVFRAFPGWEAAMFRGMSGVVWEEDGWIVGNATVQNYDPSNKMWRISNVAVTKPFRGRGIGRKLMEGSLDLIRQSGGREAVLQVRAENDVAIRLYESLGFKEVFREAWWVGGHVPLALLSQQPPDRIRPFAAGEEPQAFALLRRTAGSVASMLAPIHPGDLYATFGQRVWEAFLRFVLGRQTWRLGMWEENSLIGWALVRRSPKEGDVICYVAPSSGTSRPMSLLSHVLWLLRDTRSVEVHLWGDEPEAVEFLRRAGLNERLVLLTMFASLER